MSKSQIRSYVFTPGAAGAGTIEIPGKYDLQQLLVITNTTRNTIIYNFADSSFSGTTVSFNRNVDGYFPFALDNTDGSTTITLAVNTSTMSTNDTLQIFAESPFQYVRMPEIGTDAFERTRVAQPTSMLDADFEYGMQPTKWLTISQERGYPSIYEVPGTDLAVTAATTDASTQSGGVSTAASIITITTAVAHSYTVGQAITIKGFNSAITGFDRAEGSFLVYTIPSTTTFTYIAKGKVGYINGDNVWTAFVQLRQGGLYTGSAINAVINTTITGTTTATPVFNANFNGTTAMIYTSGTIPALGTYITGSNIPAGTYIVSGISPNFVLNQIVPTATGTSVTGSTNNITVANTTGMYPGATVVTQQISTNAVASNSANNYITLGTTIGLVVGQSLNFTGVSFGGITTGGIYYVKTIVDTRTIIMSTDAGLATTFVPSGTTVGGNMFVVSGSSFGGLTSGNTYYIGSIPNSTTITLSANIMYTTTISATYATNNSVRFNGYTLNGLTYTGTANMTVGEQITITGTAIGNLSAGTYYVYQIIDGYTAILSTVANGYQTNTFITQTSATGSMAAMVGTLVPLTTASGYLWSTTTNQPTFSTSTPTTAAAFTAYVGTNITSNITSFTNGVFTCTQPSITLTVGQIVNVAGTNTGGGSISGSATVATTNYYIIATNGTTSFTLSASLAGATITTTGSSITGWTFIAASNTMTVSAVTSGTLAVGQGIALSANNTVPSLTTITSLSPSGTGTTGTYTLSQTGAVQPSSTFISTSGQATVTVNFYSNHGFVPGQTINVFVSSDNGVNNHSAVQGPYFVENILSVTSFTFTARTVGFIQSGTIYGNIYARSDASYSHRPFDGGVQLGTGLPSYGGQAIRMSKKYIRYQSGKAINFNTGLLMAPNYFVRQVTANGTSIGSTITVVTDDVDHQCQIGATVVLSGVLTPGFNGTYVVTAVTDERTLQFLSTTTLGAITAVTGATVQDPCLLSVSNWYGATVRSGTFDEQNGVFWQYDGIIPQVVKRSSTFQLAGTITVVVGSGQIVGLNTRFTSQLFVGCRIVIRGMTHLVTQVVSDTLMYVNPQYRGATSVSGIKCTRTVDRIVPQNQWNVDRCDGSNGPFNPSGYLLIPTKMQMVCTQWTWYGAGFIDWMLRGPEGKYITVHRLRNNNVNNESWMRAGNLPVRYEVLNESAFSFIVGNNVGVTDTVINIADASRFPTPNANTFPATVYIDNELITYTGVATGYVSATSATLTVGSTPYTNVVTVSSTAQMITGQPIVFYNATTGNNIGNIASGVTYYVYSIIDSTHLQLSTTISLALMTQINATITPTQMTYGALVNCTRSVSISPWASGGYRSFLAGSATTHTATTGVILVNANCSPVVSHWGAAFIEDGGFDTDRSYIFNYSQPNVNITTKKTTAFAVRLAPSVSNALTGDLGARELINRASFLLQSLESSAGSGGGNAALVIEGVINPSNMPALTNIQFASLNSPANPTGQPSFSQVAPGSSMVFSGSVNNYMSVPVWVPSGTYYIPLSTSAASVVPAVNVGDDVFFPATNGALNGLTKVAQIQNFGASFTAAVTIGTSSSAASCTIVGTVFTTGNITSAALTVGMTITGTGVATGTYLVALLTGSGSINSGVSTWTVSISQSVTTSFTATGTLYLLTVSAITSGYTNQPILPGTLLAGNSIAANTWVGLQLSINTSLTYTAYYQGTYALINGSGTTISAQSSGAYTGIYYGVYLNQTTLTNAYGTGALAYTINLSRNTYALPGETVFTYINAPANKDSLDLTPFKELSNTPIGGRGTYPNGCDILFINAYITQGAPINQNLVLRWGEAQA